MNNIILINISNHPSINWDEEQKAGFSKIIDIKFPNIPAKWNINEVYVNAIEPVFAEIEKIIQQEKLNELNIMLMGEFSFCYFFRDMIKVIFESFKITWWIPTTERRVVEKIKENGEVEKTSVFKFVRWRKFNS